MATSQQPLPQGTPFPVKLDAPINLDNVNENVYEFQDGVAPSLTNTGILRDEGVTNLYETSLTSSQDYVYYAPNGKTVSLSTGQQTVYVDGVKAGAIGSYGLVDRMSAPLGALDFALTSSDTWLLLSRTISTTFSEAFTTNPAPGGTWQAVVYGGGVWLAAAASAGVGNTLYRSTDNGVTWSAITIPAHSPNGIYIRYGANVFMMYYATGGSLNNIARSTDYGLTWTTLTTPTSTQAVNDIQYGNGIWTIAINDSAYKQNVFTSTDNGNNWTTQTIQLIASNQKPNKLATDGLGKWWLTTQNSSVGEAVQYSADNCVTWTKLTMPVVPTGYWNLIKFGGNAVIVVDFGTGVSAQVYKSTDNGSSWSAVPIFPPVGNLWLTLTYGNGYWAITNNSVSATTSIYRSSDGTATWSAVTTPAVVAYAVACQFGSNNFVTVYNTTSTTQGILISSKVYTQSFIVNEYNPTTATVSNTTTISTTLTTEPSYACFVKSNSMTFATADIAYISFSGSTVTAKVTVSGTTYTAFTGTGKPYNYTGISAFKNGGTYIVGGICDNTSMPRSYYCASPYAAWTAINETSYLANYEDFRTNLSQTINLIGTPSMLSSANWTTFGTKVSIDTAGTVTTTTVTQAGLSITPSNAFSGFGWASGKFTSTAATKLSPFILDNAGTPVTITETVTDYGTKPIPVCSIGSIATRKAFVYGIGTTTSGANARPGQVVWGGTYGAMPIVEYGNVSNESPVVQWVNSSDYYLVSIPGTTSITLADIRPNQYNVYPISKSVLQISDSYGTIVDTVTGTVEQNAGAHCPGFVSDIYLTGTTLLAYQTGYKYTNAVDLGTITTATGLPATGMTATSIAGAVLLPITFYQAASGTLYAKGLYSYGAQIAVDTTVAYVANSNLPPPVDAVYSGGGVQLLGQSALQTVNESDADGFAQYYAGYTLANQLPVAYEFFNLFGQLYGFDGTKIYRIPVNGGTVGTPEQVAIASGMVFIANSPTVAWFFSDFDNCLYVFTGGQKLEKWQEMTGVAAVSSGAWSTLENSLYLQLADATTLIMRDNKAMKIANAYSTQTTYTTDGGTYFVSTASPSLSKLWTYYAGSGTPLTLTWQSGFYGMGRNQYSRITQVVFTLKVADATTTDIVVNYKWLTEADTGTETATLTGGTYTASSTGYVRIQYNPTQSLVYGASVGVSCSKKVILYDVVLYYTDGGVAPVTNRLP